MLTYKSQLFSTVIGITRTLSFENHRKKGEVKWSQQWFTCCALARPPHFEIRICSELTVHERTSLLVSLSIATRLHYCSKILPQMHQAKLFLFVKAWQSTVVPSVAGVVKIYRFFLRNEEQDVSRGKAKKNLEKNRLFDIFRCKVKSAFRRNRNG